MVMVERLGSYAMSANKTLYRFKWGEDNTFYILNIDNKYVEANPKEYEIVEILEQNGKENV
tara:strand:- start:269 stop:451 length:183 start_codon:yes stop_codon:yes gene_type:complete